MKSVNEIQIFMHENAFEIILSRMAPCISRTPCVNHKTWYSSCVITNIYSQIYTWNYLSFCDHGKNNLLKSAVYPCISWSHSFLKHVMWFPSRIWSTQPHIFIRIIVLSTKTIKQYDLDISDDMAKPPLSFKDSTANIDLTTYASYSYFINSF